ncbi:fumarate reductase flavoprotein subunit precursor [Cordyceps fumosorosea ARSEF 2679]|uniref:Fumarate reductase flavoprotein subunit n=1 Tax=Cordyceps fumosorosea (strain ARSEF 2679) TaxID=1081104 RepID=A0A162J2S9_CORFA|nr:fumarate reductase flavoprotein subunit precursor [Cordyceps fumosorosea ARSEF 2679]OAA62972.1 fumarate reductase flavoprotein subunit precursor [Cordyceps fumosorosea ARSEF 2679]
MAAPPACDVLVVGSGNAGFSAALSASQFGAKKVVLIDKCPEDWAGGNSFFTAGAYRVAHDGLKDVLPLVSNVSEEQAAKIQLAPYTEDDFLSDIRRVCEDKSDLTLSYALVSESNAAVKWLAANGIRFALSFNRQAYEVDGKINFWGGLCLKTLEGGKSLIEDHRDAARKQGIEVYFSTELLSLRHAVDGEHITAGVRNNEKETSITAGAVILAAGGFEANSAMRSRFLGPGWDKAAVRGTPYNTGESLELAQDSLGAQPVGDWAGCHSVAWDATHADPNKGDRLASNEYTKSGYPLGLMLNIHGRRFVDEGEDLRNYTYAKFGRAILEQSAHTAFQVWDAQTSGWLRAEEYRGERAERLEADTLEGLAELCAPRGLVDEDAFCKTIRAYNDAVHARPADAAAAWNPAVKDGLSTGTRLELPKSNWALAVDTPPFLAVKVTCGITFTFGGLRVDPATAQLIGADGERIPGVYCVGEMLGGLFHGNYPGGSGLTSGTVFGRRAGRAAAAHVGGRAASVVSRAAR